MKILLVSFVISNRIEIFSNTFENITFSPKIKWSPLSKQSVDSARNNIKIDIIISYKSLVYYRCKVVIRLLYKACLQVLFVEMDSETFNSLLSSLTLILCKHILQEMKKVAERESVERSCKRINFLYSQISDDGYKFYQCMLCDFKTEVGKEIKIHFLTH